MKISQSLVLSGLLVCGLVRAEGQEEIQKTFFQNFAASAISMTDAAAAKLYIASAIKNITGRFDANGKIGMFLNSNQDCVNRAAVVLSAAVVLVSLHKIYTALCAEQTDNDADEYFDMFDSEDNFDNDADYDDEDDDIDTH